MCSHPRPSLSILSSVPDTSHYKVTQKKEMCHPNLEGDIGLKVTLRQHYVKVNRRERDMLHPISDYSVREQSLILI